jgi:hypothetical protein
MKTDQDIEAGCAHDLTIGCVFQNEAPYLKEWIEFHKIVGVQHFVLVDDHSSDDFLETLNPYIDAGDVELYRRPCPEQLQGKDWLKYQVAVHSALVEHLCGISRWLALVDTDEFIVPFDTNNVLDFLRCHEHCGGIYIRWEPFGTSYVPKLSEGELMTERLYMKWRFERGHDMLGKSIVKPHRVRQANIHLCDLLPGFPYFDSNPGMESETAPVKVYHYWSRDENFLLNCKLPRTSRTHGWEIDQERLGYFLRLCNDVPDYSMQRFARELRSRVF